MTENVQFSINMPTLLTTYINSIFATDWAFVYFQELQQLSVITTALSLRTLEFE
jgi:hypothetical protein